MADLQVDNVRHSRLSSWPLRARLCIPRGGPARCLYLPSIARVAHLTGYAAGGFSTVQQPASQAGRQATSLVPCKGLLQLQQLLLTWDRSRPVSAVAQDLSVQLWHPLWVNRPGEEVSELLVPPGLCPVPGCAVLVQSYKVAGPFLSMLVEVGRVGVVPVFLKLLPEDTLGRQIFLW